MFSRRVLTTCKSRFSTMQSITEGVEFNTIAREWRFKWSVDNDKASLAAAQKELNNVKSEIKNSAGVNSIQRIVCGGCQDFKVIVALPADKFGAWAENDFHPEKEFLARVSNIPGINTVETQTFTTENLIL